MAGAKEIRNKIGSVKNTQKITSAMQMVAASKMRKVQERMGSSRPYAVSMRKVIGHIALGNLEYKHPYLEEREAKRVGYIIISTDRGLCGGLNINLFKATLGSMKQWKDQGADASLALLGSKACGFFGRFGYKVLAQASGFGDNPTVNDLIGSVRVMLQAYDNALKDLGGWLNLAQRAQSEPDRIARWRAAPDLIRAITPEDLQATARTYLADEAAVEVLVVPEAIALIMGLQPN